MSSDWPDPFKDVCIKHFNIRGKDKVLYKCSIWSNKQVKLGGTNTGRIRLFSFVPKKKQNPRSNLHASSNSHKKT